MISQIQIRCFKCFESAAVDFRNLTILAGSNSVGKTSVIQSILVSKVTIDKIIQFNAFDRLQATKPSIHVPLNSKFLLALGNTKEVLTRDVNSNIIFFHLIDHKNSSSLFLPLIAEDNEDDHYELQLWNDRLMEEGYFDNLRNEFYYLNAERLGPRLTYDADQLDFMHVGWQGEYTIQILSQLKGQPIEEPEKRKFPGSDDIKLLNQVRLWMNEIIPNFYLDDAVLEGKLKKAYARYSNSSPTNVGFGISYVLPIVVNGLIAKPNTHFIIENPEAHLHPYGQSKIAMFLAHVAASSVQVTIETHSEHIINSIRLQTVANVIAHEDVLINFFQREKLTSELTITQIDIQESGDLTKFPRDFFDQVQQDLAEIFRAKKKRLNG